MSKAGVAGHTRTLLQLACVFLDAGLAGVKAAHRRGPGESSFERRRRRRHRAARLDVPDEEAQDAVVARAGRDGELHAERLGGPLLLGPGMPAGSHSRGQRRRLVLARAARFGGGAVVDVERGGRKVVGRESGRAGGRGRGRGGGRSRARPEVRLGEIGVRLAVGHAGGLVCGVYGCGRGRRLARARSTSTHVCYGLVLSLELATVDHSSRWVSVAAGTCRLMVARGTRATARRVAAGKCRPQVFGGG